jgi:hypothetical protein
LRSFPDCCTPWGWDQYLSVPLRAPSLKARTDLRLGGPLHRQQPNPTPTDLQALPLMYGTFQYPYIIRSYPQFPEIIPDLKERYRRVTERFAMTCVIDLHVLLEFR